MLTSIHIKGFKGFRDTKIPELRRVNLILGGQNSGKTSLLEAVCGAYLNSGFGGGAIPSYQFGSAANCGLRKDIGNRVVKWTLTDGSFEGQLTSIVTSNSPIEVRTPSVFPVYPIEEYELVRLYDIAVTSRTKKKWIELLKIIEPRLESLESVTSERESTPSVHAELTGISSLMPLSMLGQGFNRLAYLYAGLLGQNANIALIDEIENGIHYSALPILWEGIANIARELDIQIFATTHSYECIQAAAKVFEATPEEFQLIRLERSQDGNIEPILVRDEKLNVVLKSGWEIR